MIQYVLDNEVYAYPYITWLTKGQLLWGAGVHWKDATPHLKQGIYQHAGIRKPKQAHLDGWYRKFGYYPEWPEPRCWNLVQRLVKGEFINKKASGKGFESIEFLYGKGYVDEKTGKLDPTQSAGIVGWFIMHKDPEYRQEQIEWLENQKEYIRIQYAQCCRTFVQTIQQQIESGYGKAIANQYLLDQEVYKELRNALKERKKLPEPK